MGERRGRVGEGVELRWLGVCRGQKGFLILSRGYIRML